jgi:hypothetical protein
MGYNLSYRESDEAWQNMGNDWFERALQVAHVHKATTNFEFVRHRSYTGPGAKLDMKQCSKYFLLEGVYPLPCSVLMPAMCQQSMSENCTLYHSSVFFVDVCYLLHIYLHSTRSLVVSDVTWCSNPSYMIPSGCVIPASSTTRNEMLF